MIMIDLVRTDDVVIDTVVLFTKPPTKEDIKMYVPGTFYPPFA